MGTIVGTKLHRLTALKVKNAEKGVYQDGDGLALVKRTKSTGYWRLRFSLHGNRKDISLGGYPSVSLSEARDKAREARDCIRQGHHPNTNKLRQKLAARETPTLTQAIDMVFEARKHGMKDSHRWKGPTKHVVKVYGDWPITDITQIELTDALQILWHEKYPTAKKALDRVSAALDFADAQGHAVKANAAKLAKILLGKTSHIVTPHAAMTWREIPAFYARLEPYCATNRILAFMVLIGGAARSAPVRLMRLSEVDGDVWHIPSANMKGEKGHDNSFRIPLSRAALAYLEMCKSHVAGDLVFAKADGSQVSDAMPSKKMRKFHPPFKPHGIRSTFRVWLAEHGYSFEEAEKSIAHKAGSKTVRAYQRSDLLDSRRVIMEHWASFVTGEDRAGVIQFPNIGTGS